LPSKALSQAPRGVLLKRFAFVIGAFALCGLVSTHADPVSGQSQFADLVDYALSSGSIQTKRVVVKAGEIDSLVNSQSFKIKGVDLNLVAVDGNCYCEYPNTENFLYLNLLYFGQGYIDYMNPYIKVITGHDLPPVSVQVFHDDSTAPAGYNNGNGQIRLWFGDANFDPGFVVHEISHQIHSALIGKTQQELYDDVGKNLQRKAYFEFLGVIEGVANFLTALYFDDPVIGKVAWVDIPYSMDSRVDYNSMPSEYDFINRIVQSKLFAQRYPILTVRVASTLSSLRDADEPNPYLSSQIIFQPLWQYRTHYSREGYFRFFLKFLATHPKFTSYSDFASQLVNYTKTTDPGFSKFLMDEFVARHLSVI